ncbi:ER to Golgi transport-related protein [Ceraceosorus guamensis]|uniref:ER to Golgi transport-related protein n=1 Tax=Ceraceosorus guamensis TaxID=1522189 RepID=A0A316WB74_9BASI|nr:ER to Golgi transport-related protein [Ceraceosorus guamensis]PWN45193.1 ER to Golgi transport-related protein [Ceraceosorus guamensis]
MPSRGGTDILASLKGFDAFSKPKDVYRVRTSQGALISLVAALLIALLIGSEFRSYRNITLHESLIVDKSRGEKINIAVNMTFPRVPCYLLSMDVMDISGEHQNDIHHDVTRTRLSPDGHTVETSKGLKGEAARLASLHGKDFCGSCYGGTPPASGCCNTCEEVKESYALKGWSFTNPDGIDQCVSEGWSQKIKEQNKEGCNVAGVIHVNKVVGNFHLSPGKAFQRNSMAIYDLVPYLAGNKEANHHDFGHIIHELSFGTQEEFIATQTWNNVNPLAKRPKTAKQRLGIVDPLQGVRAHTEKSQFMFQYFLKVVPTEYHLLSGERLKSHQYSVTTYERDLSPGAQAAAAAGVPSASHTTPHHVTHGFAGVPGVYINFDPSALRIIHTETRPSLAHFLTSTCAIVGGILTLAGLVDMILYNARLRINEGVESGSGGLPRSSSGGKMF